MVENEIRDFVLGGVALEGEAKERYNQIQQQLAQLSTKFSNNVSALMDVRMCPGFHTCLLITSLCSGSL